MSVVSILEEKKNELMHTNNPLTVQFTVEEINLLGDVNELRLFKLSVTAPMQFECASDVFDCHRRILIGESLYRVLEFSMLENRVLRTPITTVFPWLGNE